MPDQWIAEIEHRALRLDVFLATHYPDWSRASIQDWIRDGIVTVNQLEVKPGTKLRPNDSILVQTPLPLQTDNKNLIVPEEIPLNILYEDELMLVINKTAGMVVHPGSGVHSGTVANALAHHLGQEPEPDSTRPGIVHRLDKDTTGLLVLAKNRKAQWLLSRSFAERLVDKRYLVLVKGNISPPEGRIDKAITRHPKIRTRMTIARDGHGRNAETFYRTLENAAAHSLLECRITTGRTHQIRVHLQSLGHPVLGDRTYNPRPGSQYPRQMLHAWKLSVPHPISGKLLAFIADVPDDFHDVAGIQWHNLT